MKSKVYLFTALFFFYQTVISQNFNGETFHRHTDNHFNSSTSENFTGNSGTGANMNVVYHRVNWTIDPNSATKTITGTVVTYFKTLSANFSAISFDLNSTSFNNGALVVTYHGTVCTKTCSANILNITLPPL